MSWFTRFQLFHIFTFRNNFLKKVSVHLSLHIFSDTSKYQIYWSLYIITFQIISLFNKQNRWQYYFFSPHVGTIIQIGAYYKQSLLSVVSGCIEGACLECSPGSKECAYNLCRQTWIWWPWPILLKRFHKYGLRFKALHKVEKVHDKSNSVYVALIDIVDVLCAI